MGIVHLVVGVTLLQYTNIKAMVDRFSGDDDAEIAEYVQSSLDLSEAEMTATGTL